MSRETLERNQVPLYLLAVLVACIAGLLAPEHAASLQMLITPAIAVLMYAMFLQIPFLKLREALIDRRFVAALLVANFILIPLLVWLLSLPLTDHPALLIGALLVLLTPCIDYVVVFTHIGKGDSQRLLAATPILLVLQLALLPLYLGLMLGDSLDVPIASAPFIEAFLALIVAPLVLAVLTEAAAKHVPAVRAWNAGWAWLPVPAMAAVLMLVVASQITPIVRDIERLLPVLPVYLAFVLIAPLIGALTARLFSLPTSAAVAVTFSASTRNSLVVLPLAMALPGELRVLAAAAIITQTLVELLGELIYVRAIPALVRRNS